MKRLFFETIILALNSILNAGENTPAAPDILSVPLLATGVQVLEKAAEGDQP